MFYLHAPVHDHFQAAVSGNRCSFFVHNTQLKPEYLGTNRDSTCGQWRSNVGSLENIDNINRVRNIFQCWVAFLSQYLFIVRINRYDPIAMILQILGSKKTGSPQFADRPTTAIAVF